MHRAATLAAAPLLVSLAVFWDGGYGSASRVAFGVAALTSAAFLLPGTSPATLRRPIVLVLLALAALGAASALWTVGPVSDTLTWALVTAGYGAVTVLAAAAAGAHRRADELLAGAVAVIALASASMGLGAAVVFEAPYAERIAGVWRPGGPFEYPPALALLQVAALPALLAGMTHGSRRLAWTAAVGMALAGAVLALAASRIELALAVVVAGVALAYPRETAREGRATVLGALALAVAGGAALQAVAGSAVAPGAVPPPARLAVLIAVASLAGPAWLALRRPLARRAGRGARFGRPVGVRTAAAVVVVAVAAGSIAFGDAANRGAGPPTDFLHGRADTWRAAVATFADRPLSGAGADAFLSASARHQNGQTVVFAHNLPLELAAELGVAGAFLAVWLYLASASALLRARATRAGWLLGPAVAAFLVASLVDWPWHLAGAGAVWALALGAVTGARAHPRPPYRSATASGEVAA